MKIAFGIIVLGIIAAAGVAAILLHLNYFRTYETVATASCTPVVGVPGVEDAVTDHARNVVWLSSMNRRAGHGSKNEPERGAILAFDPENPLALSSWRDRTSGTPADFVPLGIDFYQDGQTARLFVINEADRSVLVFNVTDRNELVLLDTLRDSRLTSPNGIVAVGPKSFYVTNSSGWRRGSLMSGFDFLTRQSGGAVIYYDGNSWSEAVSGLQFPNGLAVSDDGAQLYVSESSARRLRVYQRDAGLGILQPVRRIPLDGFPANLTVSPDGTLLIGTVPKPLQFAAHAKGQDVAVPSLLLRMDPADDEFQTVFADTGEQLSGLTVGTQISQKLLLGAFAENKFLLCDGSAIAE